MSNKYGQLSNEELVTLWLALFANRCPLAKLIKKPLCIAFASGYVNAIKDIAYDYAKDEIDNITNTLDDLMEQCKNDRF